MEILTFRKILNSRQQSRHAEDLFSLFSFYQNRAKGVFLLALLANVFAGFIVILGIFHHRKAEFFLFNYPAVYRDAAILLFAFSWVAWVAFVEKMLGDFGQIISETKESQGDLPLLLEKRQAEIIAASLSEGIFLLRNHEVLYANPIGQKILGIFSNPPKSTLRLDLENEEMNQKGASAVIHAISSSVPVEYILEEGDRKSYYLIQASRISNELVTEVESTVSASLSVILEQFKADTLVLAQDVTVVRESQKAKSHFLATLSHEIKTPVTSLTMATRLLMRTIENFSNPTHRSLITTCANDVDRLRKLLDDLMKVSQFDSLAQRLEIQNIDIAKLILHSVQSFQFQAHEKGITLAHHIQSPGGPVFVAVDATKITWALSNLITNAIRHTPKGGRVDVSLEKNQNSVEIRIKDSGPGIEKQRLEKIFDKYNSYYDLRIARSGSVGAGLAIAREIVLGHGGRISANSEPGLGAEFCFSLPWKIDNLRI